MRRPTNSAFFAVFLMFTVSLGFFVAVFPCLFPIFRGFFSGFEFCLHFYFLRFLNCVLIEILFEFKFCSYKKIVYI
jgi:hypothetical protein